MSYRLSNVIVVILLLVVGITQAEYVIEDFESYTDPNFLVISDVWSEQNGNAQIKLVTSDSNDFAHVMNYEYWCGTDPYSTEALAIFPADEDWSMYDTFSMWVKGKTTSQSLENMYLNVYTGLVPDPNNHDELALLGTAVFSSVTQKPDWTYWRADIDYDFEWLGAVRAIGIGMSPVSYGHGIIQIDKLTVDDTDLGGVIDNFELYADSDALREYVTTYANTTLTLVDDPNYVLDGDHVVKVEYNMGQSPYWTKLMFSENIRHIGYNWKKLGYTSLTMFYKVTDQEAYLKVGLFNKSGARKATYLMDSGTAALPVGDWTRWDIDLLDPAVVPDPNVLNEIARVDVQLHATDYGVGEMYFDNIYVNGCGIGAYGVGGLRSNLCDSDCVINLSDFAVLASHWAETGCTSPDYCEGADFLIGGSRDGEVNFADAAIMANEWLECNLLYKGDCF